MGQGMSLAEDREVPEDGEFTEDERNRSSSGPIEDVGDIRSDEPMSSGMPHEGGTNDLQPPNRSEKNHFKGVHRPEVRVGKSNDDTEADGAIRVSSE